MINKVITVGIIIYKFKERVKCSRKSKKTNVERKARSDNENAHKSNKKSHKIK